MSGVRAIVVSAVSLGALAGVVACGTVLAIAGDDPAPAVDAGSSGDGAVDGSTNADGSAVPVDGGSTACTARFCSSFDDDPGASQVFNWDRAGPQDSLAPDYFGTRTDLFVSPPRSFRVQTDGEILGSEKWLEKKFPDATSGYIQLALRIDVATFSTDSLKVVALNCASGGDAAQVHLAVDGALSIRDKSGLDSVKVGTVPLHEWKTVRLEFAKTALGTSEVLSTLKLDGVEGQVTMTGCEPELKVRVGVTTQVVTYDVTFDDVAIDWSP